MPISYGILCIKTSKEYHSLIHNILSITRNINIFSNLCSLNNLNDFNNLKQSIQFLIISKKFSYSFFTIISGKYNINNTDYIQSLIKNLSYSEIDKLKNTDISVLIKKYNKFIKPNKINEIIEKFNIIKPMLNNITCDYTTPEWEIPKGKKEKDETMMQCAIREFTEETTINSDNINIYDNIEPIVELFKGTDNKYYMYIYYIALLNEDYEINNVSTLEASDIKFMNLDECIDKIRANNHKRKKILYNVYLYLILQLDKIKFSQLL